MIKRDEQSERAAELLRKVETYAENNDGFAAGDYANGYEFWGVGDVSATVRHNTYNYSMAQREAVRGLTDEQCAIACRLAGVENCRDDN